MEVVLSGEKPGPPRGGASRGGGVPEGGEREVGPETCFFELGASGSKAWLQIRITWGAFTTDCPASPEWIHWLLCKTLWHWNGSRPPQHLGISQT